MAPICSQSLNETTPWLVCSLIHKFGGKDEEENGTDIKKFIEEMKKAIPSNFLAKGNLFVFVDECHRTQSGDLHKAMKAFLPNALFLGFTGTPLLKADKQRSIEILGPYIHTYKFNEAVEDGVVLDLRYEARDIDQKITSQEKIDLWFTSKTKNLTDLAKAQLKKRWGTLRKVLSSQSRLEKIVADILLGYGNTGSLNERTRQCDARYVTAFFQPVSFMSSLTKLIWLANVRLSLLINPLRQTLRGKNRVKE